LNVKENNTMHASFKTFAITCILYVGLSSQTTAQLIQTDQGAPFIGTNYTDIKGHPYLFENWTEGTVKLTNGKSYTSVQLKYNLLRDELFFKDIKTEQLLAFVIPVVEFKLNEKEQGSSLYRNGYKAINENTEKSYYQVLFDGGTQLLKRTSKKINEEKPFNSASTIKSFEVLTFYYISNNNTLIKIRKDKKSVLTALANQSAALEKYIQEKSLNLKNEEDLIQLIQYYNSL
jgi:hypothetical protein